MGNIQGEDLVYYDLMGSILYGYVNQQEKLFVFDQDMGTQVPVEM